MYHIGPQARAELISNIAGLIPALTLDDELIIDDTFIPAFDMYPVFQDTIISFKNTPPPVHINVLLIYMYCKEDYEIDPVFRNLVIDRMTYLYDRNICRAWDP